MMNSLRDKKKGYVNGGYGTLMLIFYVIAYAQNFILLINNSFPQQIKNVTQLTGLCSMQDRIMWRSMVSKVSTSVLHKLCNVATNSILYVGRV